MDDSIMWHGDEPDPFEDDDPFDYDYGVLDGDEPRYGVSIADWIDEEQHSDAFLDAYMESRLGGTDYDY